MFTWDQGVLCRASPRWATLTNESAQTTKRLKIKFPKKMGRNLVSQFFSRLKTQRLHASLSLTCKEVRLVCLEGKRCFEGFFTPKLPLNSILPRVSVGAVLATFHIASKSHLVFAQYFIYADCLDTVLLSVFLFRH